MKTEFKLLVRSISSYIIIFSGVLILLWFLFVIITSLLGQSFYSSGGSIELMLFVLFLGIAVITVAAVINISLSIDLIAEARIQELKFTYQYEDFGKLMFKWGLGVIGVLVVLAVIGNYFIQRSQFKQFQSITAEVVESHRGNLEQFFFYLQDSTEILRIKEGMLSINKSSDQISWADAIILEEKLGKDRFIAFSAASDSAFLVNKRFENFVLIFFEEEKKLIQAMLAGEKVGAQVLEDEKGKIKGYYPISKNGKTMVIRIEVISKHRGGRR